MAADGQCGGPTLVSLSNAAPIQAEYSFYDVGQIDSHSDVPSCQAAFEANTSMTGDGRFTDHVGVYLR